MSHYCSPCGIWYPTERAWNLHFPASGHAPRFPCEACEYTTYFFNLKALEQHTKDVHLPPNYCSECDRSFLNDSFLQQHKRLVHVPSIYCSECNRYFKTDAALNQHLRGRAHASAEMAPRVAASRLYCETCARKFVNKQAMTQHMASVSHNRAVRKSSRQSSPAPSTSSTPRPTLMERVATAPSSLQVPPISDSRRSSIASMDDGVSLTATDDNNDLAKPPKEIEPATAAVASASVRSLNLPSTPPPEEFEETVKTPVTVLHIDIPQTPEETQTTTLTPATSVSSRSGDTVENPFGDKMPNEPASAAVVRAEAVPVVVEEMEEPGVPKETGEHHIEKEEPITCQGVKDSPTLEFVEAREEPETGEPLVATALDPPLDMKVEEETEVQLEEEAEVEAEVEVEVEAEVEVEEVAKEEEPAAAPVVPNGAIPEHLVKPEGVCVESEELIPSSAEAHTLPEEEAQSPKTTTPERIIAEPILPGTIASEAIIPETPIPEATIAKVDILSTPVPIPETAEEEPVTTKLIVAEPATTAVPEQTTPTPEQVIPEATTSTKLDVIPTPSPSPSKTSAPPPTAPQPNLDLSSSPAPSTPTKEERPRAPRAIARSLISTPAPTSTVESVTASASRSTIICPQCPATSKTLYENTDELKSHIDSAHGKNAKDAKDNKDAGKEKKGLAKGFGKIWGMGLRKFKLLG